MDRYHAVMKIPKMTLTTTAATTITTTITYKGVLTRYLLVTPDLTGNWTSTLSFVDADSKTIFTGAAHAESGTYSVPIDVEIDGTYTVTITFSGTATAGEVLYLTLWIRGM
jgi:hypothetical protein